MKRRELIKSATAITAGMMIPITVIAKPKELSAKELQKEIDQQIAKWIPMVEKTGLALPTHIRQRYLGACAYIMQRTSTFLG